jgi:4-amino-4-deoxy-L-arabinose transferase-like glycosyltransferase
MCTVLLLLAGFYYLWALLAGTGYFVIGGYEMGLEDTGDVFWVFLGLLLTRLTLGHRELAGFLRRVGQRRVITALNILFGLAVAHYLVVALFKGPTVLLFGVELGVQKIPTAFWIVAVLALARLAAGYRRLGLLLRSPRFWLMVLILLVAAVARIHEIDFGLPMNDHPDESVIIAKPLRMMKEGLHPHYFVYPSVYFYSLIVTFETAFQWPEAVDWFLPADVGHAAEKTRLYILGRLTTVFYGIFTVLLLYPVGRRLYGRARTGLLAALFLALNVQHIHNSMYITTDVPVAFYTMLCFYFAVQAFDRGRFSHWDLLAGLAAGFTASTKYNGASILVAPALVVFFFFVNELRVPAAERRVLPALWRLGWRWVLLWVVFLLGFTIGTPYAVLDYDGFTTDFIWNIDHYSEGHAGAMGSGNWWFYISYLARYGMGFGQFGLALLGIGALLWGRRQKDVLYLVFLGLYFYEISSFTVRFTRNLLPIVPLLAIYAAAGLELIVGWIGGKGEVKARRRRLAAAAGALVLIGTLYYPVQDRVVEEIKSRLAYSGALIAEWIPANIPDGAVVAAELYTPRIEWGSRRLVYQRFLYRKPPGWYADQGVGYLIFNSYAYQRYYDHPDEYAAEIAGYEALFTHPRMKLLHTINGKDDHHGPIFKIYRFKMVKDAISGKGIEGEKHHRTGPPSGA